MTQIKRSLVVAIDFGTTYSGYAFSFRVDFDRDPSKVSVLNFNVGSMMMPKMPTSVLFSPDQNFHSFGVEAEEKYPKLCDEDRREASRWYFFERFKLKLHDKMVSWDLMLADDTKKKQMRALDVFSAAIGYLKKHFTKELRKQGSFVPDNEITWVLTVPAIWQDAPKEFMRIAAVKAGIPGKQLMLALEPEAASVCCLEKHKSEQTLSTPVNVSQPGKKFILVDCGGGTIDISAFKVGKGKKLHHLHRPEGTCQGGTTVDEAFKEFLFDLLGTDGLASIDKVELLQLMRGFESAKRLQATSAKISINMPTTIKIAVEEAVKKIGKDPDSRSYKLQGKVSVVRNNIMLDQSLFLSFFQESAQAIPNSIREVMNHEKVQSVDAIMLAGGFSESDVIQDAVKKTFPDVLVLVVPSPSATVMMGAVMYGHKPDVIATRVSAFTYGVDVRALFKDGVHDKARLVIGEDGERRCKNCFDVYITIDQEVEVNTLLPYQTYYPVSSDQTSTSFNIFRSTKTKPLYVDEEGIEKIGTVRVLMPDITGGKKRKVKAALKVGGTELKLLAKDETTGKEFTTTCDFLSKN